MTPQEKEHIENAIRHIQTATDVDPWAAEIAVESMRKRITPTSVIVENGWMTKNDIAIHLINEMRNSILKNDSWTEDATTAVSEVADMAIKALEEQKWRPVSKKSPRINKRVLLQSNDGTVFVGHREKPEIIWQVTEADGRKHWVYDPENYTDDIESLPKGEDCSFESEEQHGDGLLSVNSLNYDSRFEGVTGWKPLPEPYKEDGNEQTR